MVTIIYISIIYPFIKQDYIQGSSSSRKKLVASRFHITVQSDKSLAVGHASLKLCQAEALHSMFHSWNRSISEAPSAMVNFKNQGVSILLRKKSKQCTFLFLFLTRNGTISYCQPIQGAQDCLVSFVYVWVLLRTGWVQGLVTMQGKALPFFKA